MNMSLSKTYDAQAYATVFMALEPLFSLSISFKLLTHLCGSLVK